MSQRDKSCPPLQVSTVWFQIQGSDSLRELLSLMREQEPCASAASRWMSAGVRPVSFEWRSD